MSLSSQPETKGRSAGSKSFAAGRRDVPLFDEKQWHYFQRRYRMSPRELDVARLVCSGLTNGDIAGTLGVRPGTVKTHLRSIFGKTHTRSKITMLLTFVDDVRNISGESAAPIPITEKSKPSRQTPIIGEVPKKE